jgi:hypothetical protein
VRELPYFAMRQNALGFLGENTAGLSPQHTAPSTSWKHELPKF